MAATSQKVNLGRWAVGEDFVREYLSAVDDDARIYQELGAVPPMALAARALGALLNQLALPPGTIHAAQELDSKRMVKLGEEVSCIASLSRPGRRGAWEFISADFTLYGDAGETLLSGKSTVLVPVSQAEVQEQDGR